MVDVCSLDSLGEQRTHFYIIEPFIHLQPNLSRLCTLSAPSLPDFGQVLITIVLAGESGPIEQALGLSSITFFCPFLCLACECGVTSCHSPHTVFPAMLDYAPSYSIS